MHGRRSTRGLMVDLIDNARAMAGTLTALRHRLHRRPELGLHLPETQAAVLESLDRLGLEITAGSNCTSVTAVLRGTAPAGDGVDGSRPVVLLRADMDALPVQEEVDVEYRSQIDGRMHACGHDLHTSMLVGAARLLAHRRDRLAGDVVLMFQPGEEGWEGAQHMIDEGVLEAAGRRPDAAYAIHVSSNMLFRGWVASRPGPLMAASDGVYVTVRGRGGHGSSPHLARDPIPAACEMILALQTAMTRRVNPAAHAVLTVGMIRAGIQASVIPDVVEFEATVRTIDPAVQAAVATAVEQVCRGVAAAHDVEVDLRYVQEYPATVNDPVETDAALAVAAEVVGPDAVLRLPDPVLGSEDFSRVISAVPGAMLLLGACTSDSAVVTAPANHSAAATFDDRVLPTGAALYAALALRCTGVPNAQTTADALWPAATVTTDGK